ncbi:hypothetical protein Pan110_19850 [Gimesia panareensis]|nr:hypothetical protein Pan110_19850 [Gimesia panareensis]
MSFRFFSKTAILLSITSLWIGWILVRGSTTSSESTEVPGKRTTHVTARRPVVTGTLPVDWEQPVEIAAYHSRPQFPLSMQAGEEYLLIINNLQLDPGKSETIRLALMAEATRTTPAGCYFQNSAPLPQMLSHAHQTSGDPAHQHRETLTLKSDIQESLNSPASERSFFLFVTDGDLADKKQYTRVTGKLIQHSPRVAIYLDEQQQTTELATGLTDEIIHLLEEQVLDQLAQQCGPLTDVDQDGRFTILLSPWLGKLQGGKTSINGFVRPSDFRENVAAPFSNHCDMLYLNSALKPGQELFDLLSHEVTHAVVSSIRTTQERTRGRILADEEDWLNEGIAHIMEPGYTNRDYRISEFYRKPESYPLIVPDYYRARLWRNHGCRGAVNLFLNWCNDLDPGRRFAYHFTHHPLTGVEKIEDLTGIPFPELFRQWSVSLARQSLQHQFPVESFTTNETDIHCGRFLLAGPALHTWNLTAENQCSLKIASSASAFVHLKSDSTLNQQALIKASGFPGMQLTLIRLPQNRPRLDFNAEWQPATGQTPATDKFVEIRLHIQHPEQVPVEKIGVEYCGGYLSRSDRQPRHFETASLPNELSDPPLPQIEIAQRGIFSEQRGNVTEFQLRLPRAQLKRSARGDSLMLKAVLRTQTDQQLVLQRELKLTVQPGQRLAGAETSPRQSETTRN